MFRLCAGYRAIARIDTLTSLEETSGCDDDAEASGHLRAALPVAFPHGNRLPLDIVRLVALFSVVFVSPALERGQPDARHPCPIAPLSKAMPASLSTRTPSRRRKSRSRTRRRDPPAVSPGPPRRPRRSYESCVGAVDRPVPAGARWTPRRLGMIACNDAGMGRLGRAPQSPLQTGARRMPSLSLAKALRETQRAWLPMARTALQAARRWRMRAVRSSARFTPAACWMRRRGRRSGWSIGQR